MYYKVLFMNDRNQVYDSARELQDIRKLMERSSRFISLSGLSGIAAGITALAGAFIARGWIGQEVWRHGSAEFNQLKSKLFLLAAAVLVVALAAALYFTWRRAKQNHLPLWDLSSRRLLWNMLVPLIAGGLFILAMMQYDFWFFVAPACLVFYGIALVNASKYTLSDIRYLGYLEIILGLVNTQFLGYGLYFWAAGFGLLHIIYGVIMWLKYERTK